MSTVLVHFKDLREALEKMVEHDILPSGKEFSEGKVVRKAKDYVIVRRAFDGLTETLTSFKVWFEEVF